MTTPTSSVGHATVRKSRRAKVRCLKVLSCGLVPVPVVVATLDRKTYAYLDYELRHALSSELSLDFFPGAFQATTLRGHEIDPETGVVHEGLRDSFPSPWLNCEGQWVLAASVGESFASMAINALDIWRLKHPREEGRIHAPSWRSLTAVRVLAIASGRPDPGEGEGA